MDLPSQSKNSPELPNQSTLPEPPHSDHRPLGLSRQANLRVRLKVIFFGFGPHFSVLWRFGVGAVNGDTCPKGYVSPKTCIIWRVRLHPFLLKSV